MPQPRAVYGRHRLAVASVGLLAAPRLAQAADTPYVGDLGQALATFAIFLLLLLVLRKWAWKPIVEQLQRREDDIASRVKSAENREAKALAAQNEYEQHLADLGDQADHLLTEARRKAEKDRQALLDEARQQARDLLIQAEEDISEQGDRTREELREEAADLATSVAEQLLRKELSADDRQRMLREATEHVRQQAEARR